jgi:thiamine biosynthesis lipoprotein
MRTGAFPFAQAAKRARFRQFAAMAAALMLFGSLFGCAAMRQPKRYEQVFFDVFDTVTTVILYDTSERSANEHFDELHTLLQEYHRLYDIYHAYEGLNNLYTVNHSAGKAPVVVDSRILDLIDYAKEMDVLTGGRMNIAMGRVLDLWLQYREAGLNDPDHAALPPMAELETANADANLENIVIDRAAGTLFLVGTQTQLDVGAIGKGYAAQQITEAMWQSGVTSMLLSVGGNVCSIGTRADGTAWQVGIQDPYSDGTLCAVQVLGQSVVTSGTYERFYTVDGKRYHHIIDPETLLPSTYYDSVTVISENSALADALTTGLFCMPLNQGQALVASLDGVEALWVLPDGTQAQSGGFSAYLVP